MAFRNVRFFAFVACVWPRRSLLFLWPLLLNPSPMLEVYVAVPCGCGAESQQNPTLEREGKEGRMWSTSILISIYSQGGPFSSSGARDSYACCCWFLHIFLLVPTLWAPFELSQPSQATKSKLEC